MIEKLVTSFVGYQAKVGTMREEDVDVYQYGYTLMIELFLNIIFSFVLGILLGEVKEVFFCVCLFHLEAFVGDIMQLRFGNVLYFQILQY